MRRLKNVAMTAITGKGAEMMLGEMADIVVEAVQLVAEDVDGKKTVDPDDISVVRRYGASVDDSKLVARPHHRQRKSAPRLCPRR